MTPTLLNAFSSLLLALLCLFIPTLPHSRSQRRLSLGLLAGRPSLGGDGAASYSFSGSLSTDSVLPVSKISSPLHPPVVSTACETPNLWKPLYAPPLPICLPSCLLAQSFGTLFLPLSHLALHCLHLPLLLTLSSWITSFLTASHLNYSLLVLLVFFSFFLFFFSSTLVFSSLSSPSLKGKLLD